MQQLITLTTIVLQPERNCHFMVPVYIFFQHPNYEVIGPNHFKLEKDANNLLNLTLPKSYIEIMSLIGSQPKYPVSNEPQQTSRMTTHT